jgi:hypothetical protein
VGVPAIRIRQASEKLTAGLLSWPVLARELRSIIRLLRARVRSVVTTAAGLALMAAIVGANLIVDTTSSPTPVADAQAPLPSLPSAWPTSVQLGTADGPGGAVAMKAVAPYRFRYQYLSGGVNTGGGWATWNANGQFASHYIQDSVDNGITPVFTYYMIYQSRPGGGGESSAISTNLQTTSTMQAYFNDLKLFFQRAAAFPGKMVVLHVEPDMWGYIQQRSTSDNAATVAVKVGSTGLPELAGLPDNAAGLARGIVELRDAYAPNVVLAYHASVWGTGNDIVYSDPPDSTVDALGTRAGNFYRSLGADFDIAFSEFSDRDAGFKQYQYGDGGAAWWDDGDFARNIRWIGKFVQVSGKRVAMWQIPQGNTRMRAMNNTWNHYQDNRVEWLLDEPSRSHLQQYANAGVVAHLFGRGADGAACSCDANNDGVTNPAPINGNDRASLSADDDGGFFEERVKAYYAAGPMSLSGGTSTTPPTAIPTSTPEATATASVPSEAGFSSSAAASPSAVSPGGAADIAARVTSGTSTTVLVDLEVYSPPGVKVHQQVWDSQAFAAGQERQFATSWAVPSTAAVGTYAVKVGVFSPGWGTLHDWNGSAGQLAVQAGSSPPTATSTPTRTPVLPTSTPRPTSTPTGSAAVTVTFDDQSGQNQALTGQYPSGLIDWGSGKWYHSAPWGKLTTKSVSFAGSSAKSATFKFVSPRKLVSVQAYNGGGSSSTVSLSCSGQPKKSVTLSPGQLVTISTGWIGACTTVTVASSNGWDTNFDTFVVGG